MSPRLLRPLLVGGLALVAVVALAGPANAHAQLQSTDPADGTVLPDAPTSVSLNFSESVSVADDGIRVVNGKGDRVDEENARRGGSGGVVTVDLEGDLARGTYIVSWRVLSVDSHPIQGAFQFSVGERSAVDTSLLADAEADPETGWQAVGAVLRGLVTAGALLAVGGAGFLLLLSDRSLPAWAPSSRVITIAAVVAGVALLLGIPVQAVLATGGGFGALVDPDALGRALGEGTGPAAFLTLGGLLLTVLPVRRRAAPALYVPIGAAMTLIAFAVVGHTRSATSPALMMVTDVVHVTAGAAWFGGLVMLLIHLREQRRADEPVPASVLISRYSGLATWALLAVTVAGLVLSWMEVRSLDALGSTTYGRLLLGKVAIVGLVALAGGYNRFGLVPSIVGQPDEPAQWRRMASVVRFEAVGIIGALAVTAVLVNVTPARDDTNVGKVVSTTVAFGDGTMQLVVDPGRAGPNDVHFYFLDKSGQVTPKFEALDIEFTLPAQDIGPIGHPATAAGPGHYTIPGHFFEPNGRWTITAVARIDTFTQRKAVAEATIS